MKIVVAGITGQDGVYLSQLLLDRDCEILGIDQKLSDKDLWRFRELGIDTGRIDFKDVNLLDQRAVDSLLNTYRPDFIYNFASLSSVSESFKRPVESLYVNGQITLSFLESIRTVSPATRFFQASSAEMFGETGGRTVDEISKFSPKSPYATGKVFSHFTTINYREAYNLFACCGILFNHESPCRPLNFVTRKISDCVAKIFLGQLDCFELGNMDVSRDWGFAGDYVKGMVKMMEAESPDDFILCTGQQTTLREFVEMAFSCVGIHIVWEGTGVDEKGIVESIDENALSLPITNHQSQIAQLIGREVVTVNPEFYRPSDVAMTSGDNSKAKEKLGWHPETTVSELCRMMVLKDIDRNRSRFAT